MPIHYNELLGVRSLIAIHMNPIMSANLENFEFIKTVEVKSRTSKCMEQL